MNTARVCLWFDGEVEAATQFYVSTFPNSDIHAIHYAPTDYPAGKQGEILMIDFTLMGISCMGFNGGAFAKPTEAFSFQISTIDQAETDYYWNAIIAHGGEANACGWCKDKWGISWQITPIALTEAVTNCDPIIAQKAFNAMMTMTKIDIEQLKAACGEA